ncbi:MAG: GNAT family N-acetyltransferase [Micropepsaceae bacterium]
MFRNTRDIAPGVTAILRELQRIADGLVVEAVISGSALYNALLQSGARISGRQQAVFVDIRPYRTFRDYEQSMKGDTRRRLRNRAKRLRQAHDVEHHVISERTGIERIVREVYDGRAAWLHSNGRTSPAFRDEDFRTLLTELPSAPGIELMGHVLAAKETQISTHWGFVYAGRYYWYMSAMKPGYDEFSPGLLHLGMIIEACIDRGLEGLELMPPASRYKLEWSDQVKDVETMIAPFSLKGRALFQLTNNFVPAVQRLSRMLPESLRRSLVRRLNQS